MMHHKRLMIYHIHELDGPRVAFAADTATLHRFADPMNHKRLMMDQIPLPEL